jgi:archaemetzincin
MSPLVVVPIYLGGRQPLVSELADRVSRRLAVPAEVHPPWFDPELAFDAARGQYSSTRLLAELLTCPGEGRVLGVAGVDLFVPVLTFVYGEAQLSGRAAVVSLHRLRPEAYGLPVDDGLLMERLEKEAVHELGHTFGRVHCDEPQCVMHASTWVEEIDLKGAAFCAGCGEVVGEACARA